LWSGVGKQKPTAVRAVGSTVPLNTRSFSGGFNNSSTGKFRHSVYFALANQCVRQYMYISP
jgi:hypothetical protein